MIKTFRQEKARSFNATLKRYNKIGMRVIFIALLFYLFHVWFIEKKTIGSNFRYTLYIFIVPVGLGLLVFVIYGWKFWMGVIKDAKNFLWKTGAFLMMIVSGIFYSYITLGLLACASWDFLNNNVAEESQLKVFRLPVSKFDIHRKEKIEFKYKNLYEYIPVNYRQIREYKNEKPSDWLIELTVQEGIWGYYVVRDWELIRKPS